MKIILIIIIVLVLFGILVMIASRLKRRTGSLINPIDGLHWGGTMGFLLGDTYRFCKARFKHLGIIPDSNDFENEVAMMIQGNSLGAYITFGKDLYNNINEVTVNFKSKLLNSISIDVDYSDYGINNMYQILVKQITSILKTLPSSTDKGFTRWDKQLGSRKGYVCLTIFDPSAFSILNQQQKGNLKLEVQILPY